MMTGIYFSGTGNTKFCVDRFIKEYDGSENSFSIEDAETIEKIRESSEIVFGYPVYYSNIPKILQDYVMENGTLWKGKKIFVIATMGLFSGDGAGCLARSLSHYGAVIMGGLHVKMPDCIADVKALKRGPEKNKELVAKAEEKIKRAANDMKNGKPPQEGLGIAYHLAGLFGQRLYFFCKTKNYTDRLKIDPEKCIGCGLCAKQCPMGNISMTDKTAVPGGRCTMCYRCVNLCPQQAVTLLGKKVVEQK